MKFTALLLSTVLVSATPRAPQPSETETDTKAIQGAWVIIGKETRGRAVPKRGLPKDKLTFRGGELLIGEKNPARERFTLDATHTPRRLDTTGKHGSSLGIYKLEGHKLIICWGEVGGKTRPARFQTSETDPEAFILLVLERDKAGKQ
jgi:uncharacterized protein (TIGR03067 family)